MLTLTIRNVSGKVAQSLMTLARTIARWTRKCVSFPEGPVAERRAVLDQIAAGWEQQSRRPTAEEIDEWGAAGRR